MSTVAPPRPPAPSVHPALVDSEQFIDDHIRRTQRGLKLVDLAAGLLTLAVGLLAFLLAAAVIDHWIVPGGLGPWGRSGLFALLMAGLAWFAWRQFVPLVRSINPVYAAHTIEQTAPSLKNSLLNVLLFRSHRQGMSAKVFHALEQQAAYRLSSAQAEAVIDRTGLLRLGYALVTVVAAAALYAVLSPKDLAASMGRVVAPWANIAAPSRVQVLEIQPGDASVARGERVQISAAIVGADEDDAVRIRYSTLDEAMVGESIVMNRPTGAARYSADLPRGGDAAGADGVQKDLEYWIEAGDGRSRKYKLTVYTRPTIVVQRVRYKYPAYTGDAPKVVENVGDLFGLEGTEVTVEAVANHPIQMAYVDFDADGTTDVKMNVDGKQATATFALALRDDRRTPWHLGYVLRYTTSTGLANEDPVQHRIDVTPDYAPEVSIAKPEEAELAVRVNDVVPIAVEARDPDFALQNVGLRGEVRGGEALHVDLLNARHAGLFRQEHRLTPADLQLKPGDVLEYWAVARDNREPPGVEIASEHRRLRIVDPNDPRVPQNPGGQGGDDQNQGGDEGQGGEQGGEGGAEGGQAGGGASGQAGENQSGEGAAGGGAGEGEPQQGENPEGGGAEGGDDSSEQQPSGNGEGGANSGGGESEGGPRDGSQENSANQGGEQNPGESGNSGGDGSDEASAGDSASGGDQGGGQESVSSAGEEDAEAFDRIRRRMAERQAAEQGGDAEAGDEDAEAGAEGSEQAEGDDSESPSEGGEAASSDSSDSESSTGESAGTESEGEPGESGSEDGSNEGGQADSSTSRPGDRNQQTGESSGANTESDSESENGESPESANETPAGADGGANPSNDESSAGDDTSGEGGAPEASTKGPRDQAEEDEPSQPGMEGETPTADTHGRTESDASGDQSGDRAGDGQKGGGQQAENAGEGEAGSHSPTDTGANQSSDPGAGATGTEAGDEQLADGETGESSGDQAGNGSESGEAEGETSQNPGGDRPGAGSESEAGASESASEPGSESGADAGGEADESEGSGNSSASGQQSGSPDVGHSDTGDSEPSGNDSSEQGDSSQGDSSGGSAAPPTGGGTSGGGVDGPGATSEPGGDEANLAYAREQTDLVLESLEDQFAEGKVDEELLEDLGWSQEDLRNFVDRWKGLFDSADRDGQASGAQERLDAALRSLGPAARGNLRLQGSAPADELRDLNDSYRARAPLEYADRVRAYLRGASAAEEGDD